MPKQLVSVEIKLYRNCARCGKEETPESITRRLDSVVYVAENVTRIEISPLFLNTEVQP